MLQTGKIKTDTNARDSTNGVLDKLSADTLINLADSRKAFEAQVRHSN